MSKSSTALANSHLFGDFFKVTAAHLTPDLILKAQYRLLSDVILRLRNNIVIMYYDRYLSCFGIKIPIILVNLYNLNIEY